MFIYITLSKQEICLRNYLTGAREPCYLEIGKKQIRSRLKNIEKFLNSECYKKYKSGVSACVVNEKEISKELKLVRKIKNRKIKKKIILLYKKIKEKMKQRKTKQIALICSANSADKKKVSEILLHEYVHQLMHYNKIDFQKINKKCWKWDEGLVTYLTFYALNKKRKTYIKRKKKKGNAFDTCLIYACR